MPAADALTEAFLWSTQRMVTKTATVSLHGNTYQVEPALAGRKVELVFSPFNLEQIEVRYGGHSYGPAVPHQITRHAHPKARPRDTRTATGAGDRDRLPATGRRHPPPAGRRRRTDRLRRPLLHRLRPAPSRRAAPRATVHRRLSSPTSTAARQDRARPTGERPTPAGALGLHQDAVRPQPGTVHAAPPRRARRSGRPDRLVHRPTRPRRDHRRGRRRQDRRRPRRHRRTRHLPARGHLPAQPLGRGPRHAAPHRRPRSARSRASTPRPSSRRPPTPWPPNTPNAAAPPSWSSTRRTCWTTRNWKPSAC